MKDTHINLRKLLTIIQKNSRHYEGKAEEIEEEEL